MSVDFISGLAAAQILVAGIYLLGVAIDAGVACVAGWVAVRRGVPQGPFLVLGSLGPLPLLNPVWVVVAGGLLIGGFPTAETLLFESSAEVLLLGMVAAIVLLISLLLREVGEASLLPLRWVAAAAGAVLIGSTAALTWAHDGQWHLTASLGAVTQVLASLAVGGAFCRARLRTAPEQLLRRLDQVTRRTAVMAAALAAVLLAVRASGDPRADRFVENLVLAALAVVALTWAGATLPLRMTSVVVGWGAIAGPQLSRAFEFLQASAGDPGTIKVMSIWVLLLLPVLLLGQFTVWWLVGRLPSAADNRRAW